MEKILEVNNLRTEIRGGGRSLKAVDGVSFSIEKGKILGVVGESGSGKSLTGFSIMRLLQGTPAEVTGGEIILNGRSLLKLSEREMEQVRGGEMAMVFQEPMTSLNPVYSIGRQLADAISFHNPGISKKEICQRSAELLANVGIREPEERLRSYPHELSGGMRQRVIIAMAMANDPSLLLCDEPTTALDVTIQAQILGLIRRLCRERGSAALFITHAMGVIAQIADDVLVIYCGNVMEQAPVRELFHNPCHPYTVGLMNCIPGAAGEGKQLACIEGTVPPLAEIPSGCVFSTRCGQCTERCRRERPGLYAAAPGHAVRCFLFEKEGAYHA